ncbi:MAG: hypothetical protein ABIJ46_01795 [bacterium]
MRSIEASFRKVRRENPDWSSLVAFNAAVMGRGFGKDAIRRAFRKLVDPDDYPASSRVAVLRHAYGLTKSPKDYHFWRQNSRRNVRKASSGIRSHGVKTGRT